MEKLPMIIVGGLPKPSDLSPDSIPEDVRRILRGNPEEAIRYLREKFGSRRDDE